MRHKTELDKDIHELRVRHDLGMISRHKFKSMKGQLIADHKRG